MQLWRFFKPKALGFTLKNIRQAIVDKIKGAPPRSVQVAQYVSAQAQQNNPQDVTNDEGDRCGMDRTKSAHCRKGPGGEGQFPESIKLDL